MAYFEYRPEGLDEGFHVLSFPNVSIADGQFHHIAASVSGKSFELFIDGQSHSTPHELTAALEDGPGVFFLGRKVQNPSRYAG